jgi:hypothetical protein
MKLHYSSAFWGICIIFRSIALAEPQIVTSDQIRAREVIVFGALGFPMGTSLRIKATIRPGDDFPYIHWHKHYVLEITAVAKADDPKGPQPLSKPRHLLFTTISAGAELPTDPSPEKDQYLFGRSLDLLGFEWGQFSGIPDLPPDVYPWKDIKGYSFEPILMVMHLYDKR